MADGTPVTYEELPAELKKKYDEIKATLEADLIGSYHRTRAYGIRRKGFSPEGALDEVDLSVPSEERTRAVRQEIGGMVAHSLRLHSESLVNTLEHVAVRMVKEVMKNQHSLLEPALRTYRGKVPLQPRLPLSCTSAAPGVPHSPSRTVDRINGTYPGRCQPGHSFNINMIELGHPLDGDKGEGNCSRGKDKEEAAPCDRPRHRQNILVMIKVEADASNRPVVSVAPALPVCGVDLTGDGKLGTSDEGRNPGRSQEGDRENVGRFIRPCRYAEWISSIVPVEKKDGRWRVAIDFRDLNRATPKDEYPMPVAETLINAAAGHKVLSFMDGNAGYNQIFMAPEDIHKTAFRVPGAVGLFEYVVMTFGLKNAGATYQRAMNYIFHDLIGKLVEIYIDDVVVKSLASVVVQLYEGVERVVFYLSRRMLDAETRYPEVEKLCLCLFFTCTKLHHILLTAEIIVICKSDVVKHMLSAPVLKGRLGKWMLALSEFDLRYQPAKAVKGQALADLIALNGSNDLTAEEYAALMSDTIEDATELRLWSLEKIKENKAKVARAYNKKVRPKEFQVGDLVWEAVLPLGTRDKAYGKWSPNWHGPYKVVQALKGNAYMLEELSGEKFPVAVNGQHLKKYFPSMWDDGQ
ncbi:hypothetical protein QYE76_047474 [Lolium multiflorum]|uniref:Reverse transcriptase domain-containing protein n=1 Tax=Lolium multiflorum TaxID=4521 RepID=A0AAD8X1M5_LOLMU|nr:hypothetical protein QYE76_047474 [Lolium multiflorum]